MSTEKTNPHKPKPIRVPFPEDAGPGQPPPSICGIIPPAPEVAARARKAWKEQGYEGE